MVGIRIKLKNLNGKTTKKYNIEKLNDDGIKEEHEDCLNRKYLK